MSQCCGKIPTEDDVQNIKDSLDESRSIEIEYCKAEEQKHADSLRDIENKLDQLRQDAPSAENERRQNELENKHRDEEKKLFFWQTKTEQLEGVGTHEKATFMRSIPQQNMKNEDGDHYYYDPRNYRSGVAFGDNPRKHD